MSPTECAKIFAQNIMHTSPAAIWNGIPYSHHNIIRVAYISADFHQHATATLLTGLIECHDRSRFEIIGISYGADDGSELRARLVSAFDQFYDVCLQSDLEVAKFLHKLEIDIAVDLKGYTRGARPNILGFRPRGIARARRRQARMRYRRHRLSGRIPAFAAPETAVEPISDDKFKGPFHKPPESNDLPESADWIQRVCGILDVDDKRTRIARIPMASTTTIRTRAKPIMFLKIAFSRLYVHFFLNVIKALKAGWMRDTRASMLGTARPA